MTGTGALAVIAVIWLATGLLMAFMMRRRGHNFWVWLSLGAILGPLAIPLAIERAGYHPVEYEISPTVGTGRFDVLGGIDGSPESIVAVKSALLLFGGCISSLTLVKVLDYDAEGTPAGAEARHGAEAMLSRASEEIGYRPTRLRLLFGRPDRAMTEYARDHGIELIVVGARGHGVSEALFGSITGRLVGRGSVPLFVGGRKGELINKTRDRRSPEPTEIASRFELSSLE